MELREFFAIFALYKKIFWGIVILFVSLGLIFYVFQEQTYKTTLTLNITRDVSEKTREYSYDNFYRLQADEKFADTVVRWIQAPHMVKKVFGDVIVEQYFLHKNRFNAKRLSSQVISVEFVTNNEEDAHQISQKLIKSLNLESRALNQKQKQDNWFIILGSQPVIIDSNKSIFFVLSVSCFAGFFVAFWVVMVSHYILGSNK
ncbi:MAG: hypothetical protein ABFQ53_01125 [Patescibacteria group bacterium]